MVTGGDSYLRGHEFEYCSVTTFSTDKNGLTGLVVMGGDSCSKGRQFESWHHILDGHFFTYICCKNCNVVCLITPKINDKRGRGWPIFKEWANLD